jgi:ABC-type uncharacterized transport system involved in gliding motility auxiliary subunit
MKALPALLGALGGVALSFGLLSALLALFQPLMPFGWVIANLATGTALILVSIALGFDALRERIGSGASRRRALHGTNVVLTAALSLAIIGMLSFLSTRYTHRFDWTEQRVNTLSGETLTLLDGLEDDLVLTAFFKERDSVDVRDLLDRYAHASARVEVRFVDPNVRPDLVEAHALAQEELAHGLILATRGSGPSAASARIAKASEFDITNALAKLLRSEERKLYFLTGHNERIAVAPPPAEDADEGAQSPETADGRAGFGRAAEALGHAGFEVAALLLATEQEVPADADALVIAGPTRPFFESELAAVERYVERGGALLVMVDPRARTNLYEHLAAWGANVGDDVVVDPVLSLNRQPTAPVAERYAEEHGISRSLERTVFPMARSVTADPLSGLVPVVFTSETSWAERDLDAWIRTGRAMQGDEDLIGPVPIAVAGQPSTRERDAASRLVVIGDSSFATNEFFDAFGNRELLLNTTHWLAGEETQIAVRPNVARASSVELTAGQFQAIQYLSLFVLPEGVALAGVLTWWTRRRRAGSAAA